MGLQLKLSICVCHWQAAQVRMTMTHILPRMLGHWSLYPGYFIRGRSWRKLQFKTHVSRQGKLHFRTPRTLLRLNPINWSSIKEHKPENKIHSFDLNLHKISCNTTGESFIKSTLIFIINCVMNERTDHSNVFVTKTHKHLKNDKNDEPSSFITTAGHALSLAQRY